MVTKFTPELIERMKAAQPEAWAALAEEFGPEVEAVIEFSAQQAAEAATSAKARTESNVIGRILFPNTLVQVGEDKNYNRRLRTTARRAFMKNDDAGPVRSQMKKDIAKMVEKYAHIGEDFFETVHTAVQSGAMELKGKDSDKDEDED